MKYLLAPISYLIWAILFFLMTLLAFIVSGLWLIKFEPHWFTYHANYKNYPTSFHWYWDEIRELYDIQ